MPPSFGTRLVVQMLSREDDARRAARLRKPVGLLLHPSALSFARDPLHLLESAPGSKPSPARRDRSGRASFQMCAR